MAAKRSNNSDEPVVARELRTLVQRAQQGDTAALLGIRKILDEHPEVWRHVGDLAALAEQAWVTVVAADNPLAVEALKRTLTELKADLLGEHPTRLERLLADQVVMNWMEVKYLESLAADPGSSSLGQARFRLRKLESAQKRYLTAIKTLTTLRALLPSGMAPAPSLKLYKEPEQQRA